MQPTPPYTKELNGAIKRLGRTIITQSRALKQSANLLEGLWPKIFKTAGYLINRSLTAVLDYDTPYGRLL